MITGLLSSPSLLKMKITHLSVSLRFSYFPKLCKTTSFSYIFKPKMCSLLEITFPSNYSTVYKSNRNETHYPGKNKVSLSRTQILISMDHSPMLIVVFSSKNSISHGKKWLIRKLARGKIHTSLQHLAEPASKDVLNIF